MTAKVSLASSPALSDPRTKTAIWAHALRTDLSLFVRRAFSVVNPGETFTENWHIEAMCEALAKVESGEIKRLLITVPPRHLKSICGSVAFPAWVLGRNPSRKIAVVSYGETLASEHHDNCRAVMDSDFYQRLFPKTNVTRKTAEKIETSAKGSRRALTIGGPFTGVGADTIIVDDPIKAADASRIRERERLHDYYDRTLVSRLNNKAEGAIIVIAQRLHEDDLPGYLLDKSTFTHLNLPAIADQDETIALGGGFVHHRMRGDILFPAREGAAILEETRRDMGSAAFAAQYQQNPVAADSQIIRWEQIPTYDEVPARNRCQQIVQSWDCAMGAERHSDFSVCTIWGFHQEKWKLLDLERVRLTYPELLARAKDLRTSWCAEEVLIEKVGAGLCFFQDMMKYAADEKKTNVGSWCVRAIVPRVDKRTRLQAQTALLESGLIVFPEKAPWLGELKREMMSFPQSRHDDQVDSVSQFLQWANHPRRQNLGDRLRERAQRERRLANWTQRRRY